MNAYRMFLNGILFLLLVAGSRTATAAASSASMTVIIPAVQTSVLRNPEAGKHLGIQRIGLMQRAKITWKLLRQLRAGWLKAEGQEEGDRLAKSSRTLGIIGICCLAGVIIPYVGSAAFLGALVLGIIAIVQGRSARRLGSKERTGEILGYVTVGLWLLFLLLAVALVYALLLAWGG
jgi:hypothetical protein